MLGYLYISGQTIKAERRVFTRFAGAAELENKEAFLSCVNYLVGGRTTYCPTNKKDSLHFVQNGQ